MNRFGMTGKLVCGVTTLTVLVLALTGFWALLRGEAMSGYTLMLHCTVAPVFCLFLAVTAVMGAQRNRFEGGDGRRGNRAIALRKTFFWLMLLAGIGVIMSMVLSMVPLYGTRGQEVLYELHRWSTVIFVMVAVVWGALLVSSQKKKGI
jgi:hypothetical protein